jgi:diguanylate cyclase
MQSTKSKHRLRLVKPAMHSAVPAAARSSEYYQRIENYAQRIRDTHDVGAIIDILEEALGETRALSRDPQTRPPTEQLQRTEREIEAMQIELRQLRGLVHIDHLTGLLNRSGLDLSYRRESARADRANSQLAVALLDIDDFKQLNDHHGHQAGDAALVHLADLIRSTIRPSDVAVRFGGEEFLFLLPDAEHGHAAHALQRLQNDLHHHPLVYRGTDIAMSFSAGVTIRHRGQSRDAVIATADRALYAAKRAGKQRVVTAEPNH